MEQPTPVDETLKAKGKGADVEVSVPVAEWSRCGHKQPALTRNVTRPESRVAHVASRPLNLGSSPADLGLAYEELKRGPEA